VLIVLLGLGVEGAAWGTNIAMLVYALLGWIYFGSGRASFRSKLFALHIDKDILASILRLGAPSMLMAVMTLVQAIVVFNALSRYGTTLDIAFYGVVYRVFQFLLTPIFGLMRALQPVLGINYGAKQYDRVIGSYKVFAVTAMLLTLPFWIVSLAAPGSVLGLMLKDQVFTNAQFTYFRVFMAILPVMSFIFMGMTLFPSIDKGKPAAIIGIARQLVFYVPVMLILPRFVGVSGVYFGSLAIDAIITIWTVLLVRREFVALRKRSAEPTPAAALGGL
jgi:Na+-driven multidrug efflux pump